MSDKNKDRLSYRDAGVDIDAAASAKQKIGRLVRSTFTEGVLTGLGGFGGLFQLPKDFHDPVLVASADGVGTKLKIAFLSGINNTVGRDLVNHCVNDILCTGAQPLFFLDYIATGKLEPGIVEAIVEGLSAACAESGCALIGGETAEMPDFYRSGEYDLAGTIVGAVEKDRVLTGDTVVPGDQLIGLAGNGLHTNGYSLVRKLFFKKLGLKVSDYIEDLGCTVGEELLRVHRCYYPLLRHPLEKRLIKSLAHITGGGITDNLPRSLHDGCRARISLNSWRVPPVFRFIQKEGNVEEEEMLRVFNMGIGMIAVVGEKDVGELEEILTATDESYFRIGEVVAGDVGVEYAR